VIFIGDLKGEAVIRQQIALNSRMFELGEISKHLHDQACKILLERLTNIINYDNIIDIKINQS
jgi:hypothetical protein